MENRTSVSDVKTKTYLLPVTSNFLGQVVPQSKQPDREELKGKF